MVHVDRRPDDGCIIKYCYNHLLEDYFHRECISGANCSQNPSGDFVCFGDKLNYMVVKFKVILNNEAEIFSAGFNWNGRLGWFAVDWWILICRKVYVYKFVLVKEHVV